MEISSSSSSSSSLSSARESLLKALISRGWFFKDVDPIKGLITAQLDSHGSTGSNVDSIESELINFDLRSIGGKSLPEPSRLRQTSHIQGPKVLQIASVRDISRSNMNESSGNSSNKRLLRLKLTDGQSEITAVEYSHIPSIPDGLVPGTKVRLENKATVKSGIVCLNAKTITLLGGLVQSLYEEWEMNQKYSGFSRPSLRPSDESGASWPPPFEKFQVGSSRPQQKHAGLSSNSTAQSLTVSGESSTSRKKSESQSHGVIVDKRKTEVLPPASVEDTEERPTNSDSRPKEVAEAVPVQNQAAAQKLLQKMTHSTRGGQNSRGRRHRGRAQEEESAVLTLDEWERRKAGINTSTAHNFPDVSRDEDLARELQEKFNMEDIHTQNAPEVSAADHIRMNMFNFERDDPRAPERTGFRGRGRGRGRGRRGGGRARG